MTSNIQKTIMRRVYYAYTIAVVSHSMFWQGAVLGALVALFGRLTHVASLVENILAVPIGGLPAYVGGAVSKAVMNGEVLTVLVTAFMFVLALSIAVRLLPQVVALRRVAI
jgi:hypothetical protein